MTSPDDLKKLQAELHRSYGGVPDAVPDPALVDGTLVRLARGQHPHTDEVTRGPGGQPR
ncbi:hypothetical protein Shyd_56390 [Streptomyces hydrogenans]|uniref:Uncharacterized protein n=1 Tax=Streptomyces hydrogenans TaxID=1873719 RepID=A0ABQ3PGX9_9ACTN|nr:hypothetical protein Shyd_56390 [Streptomyces hydrogenans]